jgi:hypothetical protein
VILTEAATRDAFAPGGNASGPSRPKRNASGPKRNASRLPFTPFPTLAERARLDVLLARDPLAWARVLNIQATRESAVARAALCSEEDRLALLDSSPPPVEPQHERANRRAAWILVGEVRTVLENYRGTSLDLARLSLTVPPNVDTRKAASTFMDALMGAGATGALFAVDRREDGTEHLYGVVLVPDARALVLLWCQITGAKKSCCTRRTVTGWNEYVAEQHGNLLSNLGRVFEYEFKPWPVGQGCRRLPEDVIASGVFAPPWDRSLTVLDVESTAAAPLDATRRVCSWCGGEIAPAKRKDSRHCSPLCRNQAHRRARRDAARSLPLVTDSPRPPTDTPGSPP